MLIFTFILLISISSRFSENQIVDNLVLTRNSFSFFQLPQVWYLCFFSFSIIFQKIEQFINLKKFFQNHFLHFFLVLYSHQDVGLTMLPDEFFTLCTFFSTYPWCNICFKVLVHTTYFFFFIIQITYKVCIFYTSFVQFSFFLAEIVNHCVNHMSSQDTQLWLQVCILFHYHHNFFTIILNF